MLAQAWRMLDAYLRLKQKINYLATLICEEDIAVQDIWDVQDFAG